MLQARSSILTRTPAALWRLRSFLRLCLFQFLKLIQFRDCFRCFSRPAVNSAQCIVWLRVRGIKSRGQFQFANGVLIPAPFLEQHAEHVMRRREFRISQQGVTQIFFSVVKPL